MLPLPSFIGGCVPSLVWPLSLCGAEEDWEEAFSRLGRIEAFAGSVDRGGGHYAAPLGCGPVLHTRCMREKS